MPWGSTLGPAPTGKASDITQYLPNAYAIAERRAAFHHGRLRPQEQAALLHQLHAGRAVAAAQRAGHRDRLRGQPGPPPGDSHALQPVADRQPRPPPFAARTTPMATRWSTTTATPINLPDGTTLPDQLRRRQRGSARSLHRLFGESIDYRAAGISEYNAAQMHVDKRLGHGFQVGASYTFSHATDEQSALGLFYNGDNPNNLRSGYGSGRLRPQARAELHLHLPAAQIRCIRIIR